VSHKAGSAHEGGEAEPVGVVLGSAFSDLPPPDLDLERVSVDTAFGPYELHRVVGLGRPAFIDFRHGRPHQRLPHQIDFRAQAAAFASAGCRALLVTSSVGVLDEGLPLYLPLRVTDLLTLDNRLPDGSVCTMFREPSLGGGHLVLREGLFSAALGEQLAGVAEAVGAPLAGDVVFGYAAGPRTKTRAENAMWARLGAQVNSMSLAPEVILANELEIPCAGLVVGHKYSLPGRSALDDTGEVSRSLAGSREALERIAVLFLRRARAVPFGNHLYRFGGGHRDAGS
jgi:5'-methylthioadenosine phosphorylase